MIISALMCSCKITQDVYLLLLRITINADSDNHMISFNAFTREIKDNKSDVIIIDSTDVESPSNANNVFKWMFPAATSIVLLDVFQLYLCL